MRVFELAVAERVDEDQEEIQRQSFLVLRRGDFDRFLLQCREEDYN